MSTTQTDMADKIIDLGPPDDGRYWRVISDHAVDDPKAYNAAVVGRVADGIDCTFNDAQVERWHPEVDTPAPPIVDRSRLRNVIQLNVDIQADQEHDAECRGRAAEILDRLDHKPEDFDDDVDAFEAAEGQGRTT